MAFRGPGVSLDLFDPRTHVIDPDQVSHPALRTHVVHHKADYERNARLRRVGLNRAGYFSTQDVRAVVAERIRNVEWGPALGRALSARFQEIIVDEAQDCNPSDLEVLTWLRSNGIPVTLVCDMDQSIYAFRYGERVHLERFAETYRAEDRLSLTGNFRSTPAICALAASFRSRSAPDVALGTNASLTHPILVYSYAGRTVPATIGEWFASIATSSRFGIPCDKLRILAHSERAARLACGNLSTVVQGQSKVERLARAINQFWSGTTQAGKARALESIEKLMLDVSGKRKLDEPVSKTTERLGMNRRILRRQALTVAMSLPKTCEDTDADRDAWIAAARNVLVKVGFAPPQGQSINRAISRPPKADWVCHLNVPQRRPLISFDTIHNAKGGEYEGVCVVIPPDDARKVTTTLIEAWAARSDHEPARVLYVGVTRAMRLAALAIPKSHVSTCAAILAQAQVPYELFEGPVGVSIVRVAQ